MGGATNKQQKQTKRANSKKMERKPTLAKRRSTPSSTETRPPQRHGYTLKDMTSQVKAGLKYSDRKLRRTSRAKRKTSNCNRAAAAHQGCDWLIPSDLLWPIGSSSVPPPLSHTRLSGGGALIPLTRPEDQLDSGVDSPTSPAPTPHWLLPSPPRQLPLLRVGGA